MAEATNSIAPNRRPDHQLRLERRRIAMTATMARYLARKAVETELRANTDHSEPYLNYVESSRHQHHQSLRKSHQCSTSPSQIMLRVSLIPE